MGKSKRLSLLSLIALFGLIALPIFWHLDTLPLRVWDEARLANNALELYLGGNWLVPTFDFQPDMWNTKPPLMIWLQSLFMHVVGPNELAVRLPSAIAGFLTIFFLFQFLKKEYSTLFAIIASFILLTIEGYVNIHVLRTGDYDALLILFTTLASLRFFQWHQNQENKQLYFFFLFLGLAILTKSIAALLFCPSYLLYSFYKKTSFQLLSNKHFYFGAVSLMSFTLGYYLIREQVNPGYIQAVFDNELGGRFLEVKEDNQGSFWYYFKNLYAYRIGIWFWFIPIGLAIGFAQKNKRHVSLTLYSSLLTIQYLLVISLSKTKLIWYDAPVFPFISIVIAFAIYFFYNYFKQVSFFKKELRFNSIPYIFLFIIFIVPYGKLMDRTYLPKEKHDEKEYFNITKILRSATKGNLNFNDHYLIHDGYNAHNKFYLKKLHYQDVKITTKAWDKLEKGDLVLVHQTSAKDYLKQNYKFEIIQGFGNVLRIQIEAKIINDE